MEASKGTRVGADVVWGSLSQAGPIANSLEFAKEKGLDHLAVVGTLKSLISDEFVVVRFHSAFPLSLQVHISG
jgi:hypothetical protein